MLHGFSKNDATSTCYPYVSICQTLSMYQTSAYLPSTKIHSYLTSLNDPQQYNSGHDWYDTSQCSSGVQEAIHARY